MTDYTSIGLNYFPAKPVMSTSHKPRLNGNFQRDRKRPGFCVEGCQCHANHSLSIGWLAHIWSQMSFPERLSPLLGCTQATGASYPQKMHLLVSSKTFCILSTSSTSGNYICTRNTVKILNKDFIKAVRGGGVTVL